MEQPHPFKHCVIIVNPSSTHIKRGMKFVTQLQKLFPGDAHHIIKTTREDYKDPTELIKQLNDTLDAKTLLCIAGGDGSISYIVNLLLSHADMKAKAKQATLLPLWGGNANDLAYMANGLPYTKHIDMIVREGHIATINPLHVEIRNGSKTFTNLAICYASFGASAFAAHKLNQPGHRDKRVYRLPGTRSFFEATSVTKALVDAKRFECEIDGVTQTLYDLMFINGSRIAKVNRAPIQLTDPYFYEIRTTRKRPVILGYAASLLRHMTQRRPPVATRTLQIHDPTWVQMDGEVEKVAADSEVTIRLSETPLRLLSTKLTAQA